MQQGTITHYQDVCIRCEQVTPVEVLRRPKGLYRFSACCGAPTMAQPTEAAPACNCDETIGGVSAVAVFGHRDGCPAKVGA